MNLCVPVESHEALSVTLTGVKWEGESGNALDVEAPLAGVDPPEALNRTAPTTTPDNKTAPPIEATLTRRGAFGGRR